MKNLILKIIRRLLNKKIYQYKGKNYEVIAEGIDVNLPKSDRLLDGNLVIIYKALYKDKEIGSKFFVRNKKEFLNKFKKI